MDWEYQYTDANRLVHSLRINRISYCAPDINGTHPTCDAVDNRPGGDERYSHGALDSLARSPHQCRRPRPYFPVA